MCKGLAICVNSKGKVICEGLSSHTETKSKAGIPSAKHDEWLNFEAILPNYLIPLLDDNLDKESIEILQENGLLDEKGKPHKHLIKIVKNWLKNNELKVLKLFIKNQELLTHQKVKGNIDCCSQKVEGNMNCSFQEVKGNMNCCSQEVEGNMDCFYQEIECDMNCSYQKVKGNMNCRFQEVKGNMYCCSQEVEGNMNCSYQKVKGNMNCRFQEVKGDLLISNMKNGSKKTQKLLDEFSEKYDYKNATFDNYTKWLLKKKRR